MSQTKRTSFADNEMVGLSHFHSGKVRDVYEAGEKQGANLLLVASDRISAFDCILPTLIQHKGAVLTALSSFWFKRLANVVDNHMITANLDEMPKIVPRNAYLRARSMLVRSTKVFPVECVVRGYLEGSGWKEYQATGSVCGHKLPTGLRQCDRLPQPLFTPAKKAPTGHDENINYTRFQEIVGEDVGALLKDYSQKLYVKAAEFALTRGIIIADTKFEFGTDSEGKILLIDEVLTPDSSRFWAAETYEPGKAQASFDKQFVREYLETLDWDKTPPAPELPLEIAAATSERYLAAFEFITGKKLQP